MDMIEIKITRYDSENNEFYVVSKRIEERFGSHGDVLAREIYILRDKLDEIEEKERAG